LFIISNEPITKAVQLLQNSIKNRITLSLTNVKNAKETEYIQLVIQSLNLCLQISQYNTDYLYNVALDSAEFISKKTTAGSNEYFSALVAIFRDTQEKINILSSSMEIPYVRATMYLSTTTEYIYVDQTIKYSEFVKQFYRYFKISYDKIQNSKNDADLFLTTSKAQFNKIYEKVVSAVQKTPDDDPYKAFLLCYLEKTLTVYKQTTDCFKTQIDQSKVFISQVGDGSKYALYQEIVQRVDSINAMYSSILIESFEYSKNPASVSILDSEYDIIFYRTKIVSTYVVQTSEIEMGFTI